MKRLYTERRSKRIIRGCERTVVTRTFVGEPDEHDLFLDSRFDDFPFPPDEFESRFLGTTGDGLKYSFTADRD